MASSAMVTKATRIALGGHTAGIYADMSVDGPQIGTLVAIIDRAKNLPNRKTMGKQNPYCAARLGKEAKKTETDMRGGQTPRWDQELRFTVHESPDYYQLKVSIFNDDKKTELIGETWIDLKNVVIPGGGQNDLWHGLQYKGKYSGDIRIELTYYDTRPKDEAVIERRKEAEKVEVKSSPAPHTLSGPRQPKPVKRRPLPADPTGSSPARPAAPEHAQSTPGRDPSMRPMISDHARPSSMSSGTPDPPTRSMAHEHPHRAPASHGQGVYESQHDPNRQRGSTHSRHLTNNATARQHHPRDSHGSFYEEPADMYDPRAQPAMPPVDPSRYSQPPPDFGNNHQPGDYPHPQDPRPDGYGQGFEQNTPYSRNPYETPPRQSAHTPEHQSHSGQPSYSQRSRNSPYTTPNAYGSSPPEVPQPRSAPGSGDRSNHYHRYSTSPSKNDVFRDSPLRNAVSHADFYPPRGPMQPQVEDEDDGPPPPPPAHRDGLNQPPPHQNPYNDTRSVPMPEPLSVSPGRTPVNAPPPHPQAYAPYQMDFAPSVSPSTEREPSHPGFSASSQTSYSQPRRHPSQDFADNPNESSVPPSLVAGYDPAIADAESERMIYESNAGRRRSYVPIAPAMPPQPTQPVQSLQSMQSVQPVQHREPPAYQMAIENSKPPAPTVEDDITPRTSMVLAKQGSVSPDIRSVPARKSVSPRPPSADSRSLSGIPFSPDSYDALNPNIGNASAVQHQAAPYETPEQALEAARQREVEKLRDVGPIIGNDGRVIDPTDHLPTDTWAPEPDRKGRKPEVVVRFKHAPQSSKPKHATPPRETGGQRPQSMITPTYTHQRQQSSVPQTVDSDSPVPPGGRNRLQKQPGRRNSYIPPNPNDITPPRTNNALRERENFPAHEGNHRQSTSPYSAPQQNHRPPTSSSYSPSISYHYQSPGTGPPIPAKVPIHPGNQNYPGMYSGGGGNDALSEEMKRIDIGTVGSGPGFGGGRTLRRPM